MRTTETPFSTIADPASGVSDVLTVIFLSQIVNFVTAAMEKKPCVKNAAMMMATINVWVRIVLRFSNVKKLTSGIIEIMKLDIISDSK